MSVSTDAVPPVSDLVTTEELAARLHLTPRRLHEQWRPVSTPVPMPKPIKIGKRLLWRRADIDAWLLACAAKVADQP